METYAVFNCDFNRCALKCLLFNVHVKEKVHFEIHSVKMIMYYTNVSNCEIKHRFELFKERCSFCTRAILLNKGSSSNGAPQNVNLEDS